jgi:hypothetical protein
VLYDVTDVLLENVRRFAVPGGLENLMAVVEPTSKDDLRAQVDFGLVKRHA